MRANGSVRNRAASLRLFLQRWGWLASLSLTLIYIAWHRQSAATEYITLSISKRPGGQYRRFMVDIESFLAEFSDRLRIDTFRESNGSIDTVKQLNIGQADIGLVQANTGVASRNVSSISYVFDEAIFLLS